MQEAALRQPPQLVDKPSLWGQRVIYAGGARGGEARLESDQMSRKALPCKACVEHPKGTCFAARSDYFRAARRHKNNDIISGCRKSRRLFRQPEEAALRQPPFRSYNSSIFRGCQDKRRVFQTFHRSQSVMAASVPAPSCKGARRLDGREKRCGRRMGGYCISVFRGKFTSFELKSHIFCCDLLTFWLFCSVI